MSWRKPSLRSSAALYAVVEVVHTLPVKGCHSAFEVGPGRVIARSVRWIDRNILVTPLDTRQSLEAVAD